MLSLEEWNNKSPDYILIIKIRWVSWEEVANFRTTEFEPMVEHLRG